MASELGNSSIIFSVCEMNSTASKDIVLTSLDDCILSSSLILTR